jgi:uncharacterized protein (DUF488 family)
MKSDDNMKLFYRQKILLGVLQAFGGNLSNINLQKYLFLFTKLCQKEKSYEFVPYKYGCFSFQSYADRRRLVDTGVLSAEDGWNIAEKRDFISMLDDSDQRKILLFSEKYHNTKGNDLVREVYKKYPYYAINSEISSKLMTLEEQAEIKAHTPAATDKVLFTIGYEGCSFENYLNRLIMNDVKLLVDVRKNPLSRKYGFSKGTLSETLEKLGIEYLHMPELGIDSEKRKVLKTEHDYCLLFEEYEQTVLKDNAKALEVLLEFVDSKGRVALTCFEAEPCMCHRGRVAKAVERLFAWSYEVVHI